MTPKEKNKIYDFCIDNLHTHTDWTGTYVETVYKCDNVEDFIHRLITFIEDN